MSDLRVYISAINLTPIKIIIIKINMISIFIFSISAIYFWHWLQLLKKLAKKLPFRSLNVLILPALTHSPSPQPQKFMHSNGKKNKKPPRLPTQTQIFLIISQLTLYFFFRNDNKKLVTIIELHLKPIPCKVLFLEVCLLFPQFVLLALPVALFHIPF